MQYLTLISNNYYLGFNLGDMHLTYINKYTVHIKIIESIWLILHNQLFLFLSFPLSTITSISWRGECQPKK